MSDTGVWCLGAQWVLPIDRPALERGCVLIRGERIVAVEPLGSRRPDIDLADAALLPGFVNAHTHLDLSGLRGLAPPSSDFTGWLRQVIAHRRSQSPERVPDDIRAGLAESIRHGTTLLGDISAVGQSWDTLAAAPVRSVVFREVLGLAGDPSPVWRDAQRWLMEHPDTPTCRAGLSPHAPYSVNASLIRATAWNCQRMTIHLAETAAELELLELHTGPFVPFLQELGVWDPGHLAPSVESILRRTSRSPAVIYAHGNFLKPDASIPPTGTVAYCPRTHAAFGHPPHPFRRFLDRGVRVALGTDSLASNPDLSVLAEARFIHRAHPDLPADVILRMATLSGAEALCWADDCGSLTAGKSADLVAVPSAATTEPADAILDSDAAVSAVLCRGRWVHGGPGAVK